MTKDYCEILLNSVRTIVDTELHKQENKIDHVEVCTVLENAGSKDNPAIAIYWVQSEGGQRYQVNSDLTDLEIGDQIYVQQAGDGGRFVMGRKLSSANLPITTVQAFERFFPIETFENNTVYYVNQVEQYTRLSIECLVSNITDEDYVELSLLLSNDNIYKVKLEKADMLGAPEAFTSILQKKIFDISNLRGRIKQISVLATNKEVFNDIKINLGYDLDSIQTETPLNLYTTDDKIYKTDINSNFMPGEIDTRSLSWRWIFKDENGELQGLSSLDTKPEGYEYYLYYYDEDNNTGDMYGGLNWILFDKYTKSITLNSKKQENKYKLIITYNGTYIVSNELVFTNEQITKPDSIRDMKFVFSDRSRGQYDFYEYDGYLQEVHFHEAEVERTLTLQYNKKAIAEIEKIVWTIPTDLIRTIKIGTVEYGKDQNETVELIGDNIEGAEVLTYKLKEYSCFAENDGKIKCSIYVKGEEAPYVCEQEILLAVAGANGTDNYIVARFYDAKYNLKHCIEYGKPRYLEINIYNGEGINITSQVNSFNFEWYGQTENYDYDEFGNVKALEGDQKYIELIKKTPVSAFDESTQDKTNRFKIELKQSNSKEYLYLCPIIHLTLNYNGLNLTKDIVLPICFDSDYRQYVGPSIIQYDYEGGNPKCARTKPSLLAISEPSKEDLPKLSWYLVTNDRYAGYPDYNLITNVLDPKAAYDSRLSKAEERKYYLCNLIAYTGASVQEDGSLVEESEGSFKVYWSQPVHIAQSRHFSTILDDWDGAMQINEDNNYILASTFAAGRKNSYNQFSGTVIGTFGTIIDNEKTTETGIKGFKDGVQVYEFSDNGTASIGPSGTGQLKFDGWNGSIKSGWFDGEIDENSNKSIKDKTKIGKSGSYWNLNTGEFITNDGYFRGELHANKLFIDDEVKEESGILSTARFETYADAEKAIFESEIDYLTHTADTQTRANARINSFVDNQEAINSMNASFSYDKTGVPTANYIVDWGEGNALAPTEFDPDRIYEDSSAYLKNGSSRELIFYGGTWTDYFILPEDVSVVYESAFSAIHDGITIYYQGTKPTYYTMTATPLYTIKFASIINNTQNPIMKWDTESQYYYLDDLWYYKNSKWNSDGELYKDIVDVANNSRISTWDTKKRYRCKEFNIYEYDNLEATWLEEKDVKLPTEGEIKFDPGIENRLVNYIYYSKSPTKLTFNGIDYSLASEETNNNLPKEFFRNGGGSYWNAEDKQYQYIPTEGEKIKIDTELTYYSHEYGAYYRHVSNDDSLKDWIGGWKQIQFIEETKDPTLPENLGSFNPFNLIKYNNRYYVYNFQTNQWEKRPTLAYVSAEYSPLARTNYYSNKTHYVVCQWVGEGENQRIDKCYVYFNSPKGDWQLFRPEENDFKYSKYTPTNLAASSDQGKTEVIGTIPVISELKTATEDVVEYNKEYYIKVSVTGEDGETYNNYYNYSEENEFDIEEIKKDEEVIQITKTSDSLNIYKYLDRLCKYDEKWNYEDLFLKEDESALSKITYVVDEDLGWQPEAKEDAEEIYHEFNINRIYKVGEDFYEYTEGIGWHKIKTAAATSASLVQWANAAGAQSALTTQFVNGLNRNIVAVKEFKESEHTADADKKNCYYDVSTGKYWVWDNRKWVEYEPSMSTSAQIKQIANAAKAQIDLTAKFNIDVVEISTGSWSSDGKDVKKAYYVSNEDKTYLYIEKESDYNTYIEAMYDIAPDWGVSGWYSVTGKLQPSMAAISTRTTGLESTMQLKVGYGENANLTTKIYKHATDFYNDFSNISPLPALVYVYYKEEYSSNNGPGGFAGDYSGWYYLPKGASQGYWSDYRLENGDHNLSDDTRKLHNIPSLASIDLKANAEGASINMMFGSGSILSLNEKDEVYLRADKIDFSVGNGMKIYGTKSGGTADKPVFWLQADKQTSTGTYIDVLELGGARVTLDKIVGLNFALATRLGGNVPDGSSNQYIFAITKDITINTDGVSEIIEPLGGFLQDGSLKVPLIKATDTEDLKTGNLTGKSQTTGEGESSTTTYPLISNYNINAKELLAEKATINGVQIGHNGVKTETGQVILNRLVSSGSDSEIVAFKLTNCDIPDYLKKNSLDVSDLDNKIGFNRFAYDGTGTDKLVYYYTLSEENVTGSNTIGKVYYKNNSYYLVDDKSSSGRVPGYNKTAVSIPLFNSGYYYSISNLSTVTGASQVQKITVFDWGTSDGVFYRGNLSTLSINNYISDTTPYTYSTYELGESIKQGDKTYYLVTEKQVKVDVPWTFNVYVKASYTIGNSSISIDSVY